MQTPPPTEVDAPTIQALFGDAWARQAADDIEDCAASVEQIKDMLQIQ